MFYKYLQKTVSKTIRNFEGPQISKMFIGFDQPEVRLNKGVRGRLIDHCNYLIKESALKGFDAQFIYANTKKLEYEAHDYHDYVVDTRSKE